MRFGKRVAIAIAGGLVVLVGIAMLVLPGPGLLVIPLGLAILALEFERPRIWLERMKAKGHDLKHRVDVMRRRQHDHK
jgi:tellurite resistance protein TerC